MDIRKLDRKQRNDLYEAVLSLACKRVWSKADARDLTQQAFLLLHTTRPWSPERPTTLEQHMLGILTSVLSQQRRVDARRSRAERRYGGEELALSEGGRSVEALALDLAARQYTEALAAEQIRQLRERVADFPADLETIDHMSEGATKRADLVALTGRSTQEMQTVLARIRRHMDNIVAAERDEDKDEEVK